MIRDFLPTFASGLHRKSAEIERIFDALSIGIAVADDPDCGEIRINQALAQLLGVAPAHTLSFETPDDQAPFTIFKDGQPVSPRDWPLRRAARTGEIRDEEIEVLQANGRRTILNVYAAPLLDDDQRPCGGVAVAIDVTERRRVEREQRFLADASRILASSLDYDVTFGELAQLATPMFGDYCVVDVLREDGSFNRIAFVVADPLKRDIADALRKYPPSLRVDSPAARGIRSGEPVVANEVPPDMLSRAAQSPEHLDLLTRFGVRAFMMAPLRARGRTLGLLSGGTFDEGRTYGPRDVALAADLGSRAGLALDNALLYQHTQEANRLKEDFLATLSHELRTPLNALLGWTQMLKATGIDDATRRRALESVERNAHAQAVLINDLLDVSRVMSGKLRLDEQQIDMQAVILGAVDSVRPAVRARDIELSVSLAPLSGSVVGDPDRLQQVIWNLLSNAVKFTAPQGRVDLSVEETGGAVQIVVSDTGAGIDPAFLPHVFERFRQADSTTTRSHGGLGLGLAIVRHLVDLHGGTVTAESDGNGRGSRFVVTLPLRKWTRADAVNGAAEETGTGMLRGLRVLAVDDDQDTRELVLLILRAAGADVMVVSAATTALDVVDSFRPHVLISDVAMPGMDGYALIRELRAQGGLTPSPVAIALTAYAAPEDVRRAAEAGFALHLTKPADCARLVRAIADLGLERRDAPV
jgi:signal transduction histidine kinase/ActR/RegA family two-component response regulator